MATSSERRSPGRSVFEVFLDNTIRKPIQFGGMIGIVLILARLYYNFFVDPDFIYSADQFVQQLIFGLSQGSIYALIALGYTLVYGILFMINFAHGEVFMAGSYMGFFIIYAMDQSGFLEANTLIALVVTISAGAIASVIVAVLLERIAYRPLRGAPRLVPLITAIGASITLQELFRRLFGASSRRYPDVSLIVLRDQFPEQTRVSGGEYVDGIDLIGGIYEVSLLGLELRLRPISFIVFFISLLLMYALWYFIQNTKTGRAMRAVAEDKDTSRLMGIDVDRVIVITFAVGGALAGAAGVMFALIPGNGQIDPRMGFLPGIKAFTAAVIGGIGNVRGAVAGGLLLGLLESVGPSMLGLDNQLKDVVAFGILVFILIFRPTGIFGEVVADKKV